MLISYIGRRDEQKLSAIWDTEINRFINNVNKVYYRHQKIKEIRAAFRGNKEYLQGDIFGLRK